MLILRGVNFGCVFVGAGTLNFFGQGWPWHKFAKLIPGFDFTGATFVSKTITLNPQKGNMPLKNNFQPVEFFPRCIKVNFLKAVAVNAVALSGPGAKALLETKKWQGLARPFFISFMAIEPTKEKRLQETKGFVDLLKKYLPGFKSKIGLEINVSCPNTKHDPKKLAEEAIDYLDAASALNIPLVIKVNALMSDETARSIEDSGLCDALTISNTIPWDEVPEKIRIKCFGSAESPLKKYGFGNGGFSGRPVLPMVLEKILGLRDFGITLPIIGGGGITRPEDVVAFSAAGADAISFATASMVRPWNVRPIIRVSHQFLGGDR
ncbi:hypothetical protein KKB71_01860 [Patescibacteria group bacterium]|nr:hypothetical protein [Patescibacteria group bacterium]MBU2219112.1 hypothetical protein [Patescibacteria group bacterium]